MKKNDWVTVIREGHKYFGRTGRIVATYFAKFTCDVQLGSSGPIETICYDDIKPAEQISIDKLMGVRI